MHRLPGDSEMLQTIFYYHHLSTSKPRAYTIFTDFHYQTNVLKAANRRLTVLVTWLTRQPYWPKSNPTELEDSTLKIKHSFSAKQIFLCLPPCIVYLVTYCTPKIAESTGKPGPELREFIQTHLFFFRQWKKLVPLNSCTSSSICQLRILLSVHFSSDIFWVALITLEVEGFALHMYSTVTVQKDDSSLLLLPLASLVQSQMTPTTSQPSVVTWAKLQKFIPDMLLAVYGFPVVLCKDKTFHRSILA